MNKFLGYISNPYFQLAIVMATLVLGFLAWRFPVDSELKVLRVGMITNVQPINIAGGIKKEDVRIYYRDREIKNLTYFKFKIHNGGNVAIVPEDFKEPLTLRFPTGVTIFDFSLTPPGYMSASIENGNELRLTSSLINPGDVIDIEVVAETDEKMLLSADVGVSGRIVGISNLSIESQGEGDFLTDAERKTEARKDIFEFFKLIAVYGAMIFLLFLLSKLSAYKGSEYWLVSKITDYALMTVAGGVMIACIIAMGIFLFLAMRTVYFAI